MTDEEFLERIKAKIERLTEKHIELLLDREDKTRIQVEFALSVPRVTLGAHVLDYPGFARMAVEYAVACIRERREITPLEFHVLLERN